MTQLDLFTQKPVITSDYHEDWEPTRNSCWECKHLDPIWNGHKKPSKCMLHGHEVCRVSGICSSYEDSGLFDL